MIFLPNDTHFIYLWLCNYEQLFYYKQLIQEKIDVVQNSQKGNRLTWVGVGERTGREHFLSFRETAILWSLPLLIMIVLSMDKLQNWGAGGSRLT